MTDDQKQQQDRLTVPKSGTYRIGQNLKAAVEAATETIVTFLTVVREVDAEIKQKREDDQ